MAEFMVFVYEYRLPRRHSSNGAGRGQVLVNIQCESCKYCVDTATLHPLERQTGNRHRRDNMHTKGFINKVLITDDIFVIAENKR
jgi:hypothetical protein